MRAKARDAATRHRLFDWRFLVALAALLAIASIVLSGYQRAALAERSSGRADRLAAALQQREETSRLALVAFTAQRQMFLANQRELLAQLRKLQRADEALRKYLVSRGIELPAQLTARSSPAGGAPAGVAPPSARPPTSRSGARGKGQTSPPANKNTPSPATPATPQTVPNEQTPGPVRGLVDQLLGDALP